MSQSGLRDEMDVEFRVLRCLRAEAVRVQGCVGVRVLGLGFIVWTTTGTTGTPTPQPEGTYWNHGTTKNASMTTSYDSYVLQGFRT